MQHLATPSRRLMSLFVAVPFIAAACSTAAGDATAEPTLTTTSEEAVTAAVDEPAAEEAPAEAPAAWLDIELTDAESGETFTLASLAGNVVAIEPMAIWCGNCKAQQDNVQQAYDQIEAAGVTYISLGIDPGEAPEALAKYADRRGYEWTFVQSPVELSRGLSDLFGPQILSAPSTPLIVLDASGDVVFQDYGFHDPDKLLGILEEAAA